jgi:multicomponent Na+:H+ antiporter subunit E
MGLVARVVLLVTIWLLAWGDISVANVVTGVVLAAVLLVAFPPRRVGDGASRRPATRIRPLGVARLLVYILVQLVTSNVLVSREILSRRSRIRTGVIAHQVADPSDDVLTVMSNVIALSPGTMTVDVARDPAVIHVHFLLLSDVESAHRTLARLERLTHAAVGPPRPPASSSPTAAEASS